MKTILKRCFDDEKGLETVEYAIIAGLIVVGVIATVASIGAWVNTKFNDLLTALSSGQ
jgi:Flp pilus assembly pilin Flp